MEIHIPIVVGSDTTDISYFSTTFTTKVLICANCGTAFRTDCHTNHYL